MSMVAVELYSRRYPRTPVLPDAALATLHVRQAFPHVAKLATRHEVDGSYLYRADAEGFAVGPPLAGYGVAATESTDYQRVARDNRANAQKGSD